MLSRAKEEKNASSWEKKGCVEPEIIDFLTRMKDEREASFERLKELRQTYSECVFSGSWIFTVLGLLVAIPFGMRWKSYNPLVVGFLGGGAGDLYRSYYYVCSPLREKIQRLEEQLDED
ncbi:hypothetical protein GAYE_SCF59G6433 [Galdieria yellowstonensis]|uniref:Uncharacterized protein n=1 Tax=Galdieria yellowstonensis TaxID=3028027 RepID=A0AAV9IMK8_9RHOD|nr:hypothetical protein GAYE_SCF59G6433 [Galdieria yellowstonensis]